MVGVGLAPSSGLRVRKKRKETTIIEVNTIYSPELLNGWDLHMARPRQTEEQTDRQTEQTDRLKNRNTEDDHIQVAVHLSHTHQQINTDILTPT